MQDRYWDIYRSPGVGWERRDRHTGHRRVITKGSSSLEAVRYLSTSLVTRPLFRLTQKKLRPIYDPVPQPARISHIYISFRFVLRKTFEYLDDSRRSYVNSCRSSFRSRRERDDKNRERERDSYADRYRLTRAIKYILIRAHRDR